MFASRVDDAAARVLNVFANDFCEVVNCKARFAKLRDVRLHDDLLDVAAISVDLSDTCNGTQLRLDYIFLHFPERHQLRLPRGRSIWRIRCIVDGVIKYFAEAGRNRNELGCEPGWQRIGRTLQTLGYELTRAVNVALVGELKCDL